MRTFGANMALLLVNSQRHPVDVPATRRCSGCFATICI
jgi:hypothetical protein